MRLSDTAPPLAPKDLARELGYDGIRQILALLCNAYNDLRDAKFVEADTPEDTITEEWFVKIQLRWCRDRSITLVPMPQKQDRQRAAKCGRPPTIDFCFRDEAFPESYFGAECKLLDEGCKKHLDEYMHGERGIGRFLSGKYAASTGAGAMVGYVRTGDAKAVAQKLRERFQEKNTTDDSPSIKKADLLSNFEHLYASEHNRNYGVTPFACYHLLFPFFCKVAG